MPSIEIARTPLQEMKVDAVAYGAKDTGEMGGGAAAAVLAAAGPELLGALSSELARSTRQIGDAVITDAFGLRERGVRWVVHVISIIRNTPQGAWCPHPERLPDGVLKALHLASARGAQSIAFSMLGTGEGRVAPAEAARLMLRGVRAFQGAIDVRFALPTQRDYEAMQAAVRSGWRDSP